VSYQSARPRKLLLRAVLFGIAIIVMVIIALTLVGRHNNTMQTGAVPTVGYEVHDYPPEVVNIPLYVGATHVSTSTVWPNDWRRLSYEVEVFDALGTLAQFYRSEMARLGWEQLYKNDIHLGNEVLLGYRWTNEGSDSPSNLEASIRITSDATSGVSGRAFVDIGLYRVPNLNRVPRYPDAEDIRSEESRPAESKTRQIITYQVQATSKGVREYYANVMKNSGWVIKSDLDKADSIEYSYFSGGPDFVRTSATLRILISETQGDITYVTMVVNIEGDYSK
jgi:hypothetical protein